MTETTKTPHTRRITLSISIEADVPADRVPHMLLEFPAMADRMKGTPVQAYPAFLAELRADDERREIACVHAEVRDLGERIAEYAFVRSDDEEPDRREVRVADDRLLKALGYARRPTESDGQ